MRYKMSYRNSRIGHLGTDSAAQQGRWSPTLCFSSMSKGIPTNYEEWLREAQEAYLAARNKVAETGTEIEDIFCYAAEFAAEKRSIVDKNVIARMNELVTEMVHEDYASDNKSRSRYKFHFVSGYVFAHVAAGLIEEKEGDWILGYINDEWDLFNET